MPNIELYNAIAFNRAMSQKDVKESKSVRVFEVLTVAAAAIVVAGAALVS